MTDNVTTPIPSSTTFKTKDTGTNGHLPGHVLYDEAEAEVLGQVTANPAANTVLGRLKDILTGIILAAGTNLIGRVSASLETTTIYNGTTALTPKFAKIAASSSGANMIVSAVVGKKIRVLSWEVMPNAAVNAKWQSHVTPTDLSGLYYMTNQGNGIARAFSPVGHFETVSGEALDLNLSAAVAVGGSLVYVEV